MKYENILKKMTENHQFKVGYSVIKKYICFMIKRLKGKEITKMLKIFPIVAVIGPRQCGKTTSAQMLALYNNPTGIYFDLESPRDRARFDDTEFFLERLVQDVDCIVIDEIQRMPELFAVLRSLVDRNKQKGKFLLLGSAAPELIKGVSESLAGRIAYCEIAPFGILEVCKRPSDLQKMWFRGGFPDAWLSKSEENWFYWMDNFFRTFVERDLNSLFGLNFSPSLMYRIWRMLAHSNGQVWNANNFSKGLDVSPTTINRYVESLEGAFMVRRLPAYFINAKKRLVKSPKIYIRDSGMLHYLLDIHHQKDLQFHPQIGFSWEGFAVEQILQQVPHHVQAFYYRTHDGSEMDLVLIKGIEPIASIELKATENPKLSRGFYESIEDIKSTNNFVITPGRFPAYNLAENVAVCGLEEFVKFKLPELIK